MYDVRQFATYDQGWIGWFCQKAIEVKRGILKEPFIISVNGKQVRDILYIKDVVDLHFKIIEKVEEVKGQAFNIGGGMENNLSLLELFGILEEELSINLIYTKLPWRKSDQKVFVANLDQVKQLVRWKPDTNMNDGIKKILDWIKNNICF